MITDEDGMDMYSVGISRENVKKLLDDVTHSDSIRWKTSDSGLLIRGTPDGLKLIFQTSEPPFSRQRNLSADESKSFIGKLKATSLAWNKNLN